MSPEQIEQEFAEALADRVEWGDGTQYISVADAVRITHSLLPQATTSVQYKPSMDDRDSWIRDTPWPPQDLNPGEKCLRRTVTSYAPVVGPWEAVDGAVEGGVIRFKPGEVYLDPDDPEEPFKRHSGADS